MLYAIQNWSSWITKATKKTQNMLLGWFYTYESTYIRIWAIQNHTVASIMSFAVISEVLPLYNLSHSLKVKAESLVSVINKAFPIHSSMIT